MINDFVMSVFSTNRSLFYIKVDAERLDKQDLLDRIEQLEKALEQKTKVSYKFFDRNILKSGNIC